MHQGLTPEGKGYRSARDGFNLGVHNMFWENDRSLMRSSGFLEDNKIFDQTFGNFNKP